MHETLQLLSVCVCVCVRERRKIELTVLGKKVPIPLDRIRTCTSGIRAHRASDYTTRVGPHRVSRNKHLRHSLASSTAKQSCMKHSDSSPWDRDVKYLQGCVCVCARVRVSECESGAVQDSQSASRSEIEARLERNLNGRDDSGAQLSQGWVRCPSGLASLHDLWLSTRSPYQSYSFSRA